MKINLLSLLCGVLFFSSCTNELFSDLEEETNECGNIEFLLPHFESENSKETRTVFSKSNLVAKWNGTETVGVCSKTNTSAVVPFKITTPNDTSHYDYDQSFRRQTAANTTSVDFLVKKGIYYQAYYPYSASNTGSSVNVDYSYNKAIASSDGTSSISLTQMDLLYAPAQRCKDDNSLQLVFNRKMALACIYIQNVPDTRWKKITLSTENGKKTLAVKGVLSLVDGKVGSVEYASSVILKEASANTSFGVTGGKTRIYFPLLPCTTGKLKLDLESTDGTVYTANLASKYVQQGVYYEWVVENLAWPNSGFENGHEYVDLGLSVKWAKMNVGATSPEDYGNYYAWGETKGYGEEDPTNLVNYKYNNSQSYVKTCFNARTYKWTVEMRYESVSKTYYAIYDDKYGCDKYGNLNRETLELEDDAVAQNMGGKWRMPTAEEYEELLDSCYLVWTDNYNKTGVKGYIFYKAISPSDKGIFVHSDGTPLNAYNLSVPHIFLPAAGYIEDQTFKDVGTYCWYYLSSLRTRRPICGWTILGVMCGFDSHGWFEFNGSSMYHGMPVRGVCEK